MEARNAQEELALIRRLMEESQRVIGDHAWPFIVWGLLITVALVLTYGVVALGWPLGLGWVWGLPMGAGWVLSVWLGWRGRARTPAHTAAGQILAGIWIGFGIAMTLLFFAGYFGGALPGRSIGGVAAMALGAAYFASGFVPGQSGLRQLAVGWWAGGLVMLLVPGTYTILLMAGLMVALQVVPGVVMYHRARGELQRAAA